MEASEGGAGGGADFLVKRTLFLPRGLGCFPPGGAGGRTGLFLPRAFEVQTEVAGVVGEGRERWAASRTVGACAEPENPLDGAEFSSSDITSITGSATFDSPLRPLRGGAMAATTLVLTKAPRCNYTALD